MPKENLLCRNKVGFEVDNEPFKRADHCLLYLQDTEKEIRKEVDEAIAKAKV